MHTEELWQIYADNGTPIEGKGAGRATFNADKSLIMGNAHIWFWKSDDKTVEIMLQKRALTKPDRPGWYHISAGGHINVGETAVEAAIRECHEEMGFAIDPQKLHFVHSMRIIEKDPRDIVNVFLYRLNGDEKFTYLDGEVDSYEWRTLENFKEISKDPSSNNLLPQGDLYFGALVTALEYISRR
jgi:8-oxo-dGTP pyrophosphatase MutT (NUDIX family)